MQNMGQAMMDALTPSLTSCPSEPHICPFCQKLVPPTVLSVLGIEKKVQPRCKCEVEEWEKGMHEPEVLKQKRDIEARFSISNLGERFSDSTFDKFKPIPGTEKALDLCKSYADSFPSYGPDALLIWGEYGNGKSHLAAAVAHTVQSKGHTVVFQTMPELLERIRETFNDRKNKETEKDIMYALQNCELMVLDDIGAEKVSDWVQDVLFRIVDGRYRQKKPILYTTNLKPGDLKDRVGPRIYDRMMETSILVQNTGTSYRMQIAEKRYRKPQDWDRG
jgi:DNA replication protein DnaC